ncbi:MAG: hypothetical protein LBQ71_17310 [Hungatella sp.]|nr:hypothetical protein [Hungatella sp.]
MKIIKKVICTLLVASLVLGANVIAFASEPTVDKSHNAALEIDMNSDSFDVTKPYEVSKQIVNDRGETVTIGAVYTPNKDYNPYLRWSSSQNASVGTWTSYYDGSIACSMQYDFDVSRSGSHWKISNGRNLVAHAIISTIEGKSLKINRATSTSAYAAEIMGTCTIKVLDTPIGSAATIDAWIKTTINDSGTLTVSGN